MADDFRDGQELTCAGCGLEIGRLVDVAGEDLVQIGGLIVSEIDGNCVRCGEAFHYSLNARRLERLVRGREGREAVGNWLS